MRSVERVNRAILFDLFPPKKQSAMTKRSQAQVARLQPYVHHYRTNPAFCGARSPTRLTSFFEDEVTCPLCRPPTTGTWKERVVAATQRTLLGAILLGALDDQGDIRPLCFGPAVANSMGDIFCHYIDADERCHFDYICSQVDLDASVTRLAERLKLNEQERGELWAAIRSWVHNRK